MLAGIEFDYVIDYVSNARELYQSIKNTGGHAITAVCRFRFMDTRKFDLSELVQSIDLIEGFLSLLNGEKCPVVLPIAFDSNGTEVWRGWNACKGVRWSYHPNWITDLPGKLAESVFEGFCTRWMDKDWHKPFAQAIEWYVEARQGSLNTKLLLIQSALEMMCWVQLVEVGNNILAPSRFDALAASVKIRLLLDHFGIEISIPQSMIELNSNSGNKPHAYQDGPHAITEIRNSIVHPKKSKRDSLEGRDRLKDEAARLACFYMERVILALCGYKGPISAHSLFIESQDGL